MKNVLIFGRGTYCNTMFPHLKQRYNIVGMLDNKVKDEAFDEKFQLKVYNPIYASKFDDCYIICMSMYYIDMWKQLKDLGISDEHILFGITMKPFVNLIYEETFGKGQKLISDNDSLIYILADESRYPFTSEKEFNSIIQNIQRRKFPYIMYFANMPLIPASRLFGCERGRAVDRYYIENFLEQYHSDIKGTVMEIASNNYIRKFGGKKVDKEIILHVKGWGNNAIKGNLETGEGLSENMVDCLICTQTLQYIYDIKETVKNIYKILKPGGVALITVPGIKSLSEYDNNNWGEKWSFTECSMKLSFEDVFDKDNVIVESYGNVKIAIAYLYGLCCEDLSDEDFLYNDKQYPFLITVRVKKQ